MQEIRVVEFPKLGRAVNTVIPETVIDVAPQDALGPNVEAVAFGVPVPVIVIPMLLGMVMPGLVDQVHDPAGITMISPSTAVCVGPLMTALTLA